MCTRDGEWPGGLLADVEVHLYCADGHEEATTTTDARGKAIFSDAEVEEGLNGIMLGHNTDEAGGLNDIAYQTQSHYLTATFYDPQDLEQPIRPKETSTVLPPLPIEITSFGACRSGDSIYVYGGHTGEAHHYSMESQNNKLLGLDLTRPGDGWRLIATGVRLQGLGMVAHGKHLILIGGFTAQNSEGQKHDLHSRASVRAYNLNSDTWVDLPSLPQPRSSHDAAIIGDTIYVVGGWNMQGESNTIWHATACSLDLSAEQPSWVELPNPPFKRRALSVVAHQGKLFVIGGMNETAGPTREVISFDPSSKSWSEAGALESENPMAGFGASAWSIQGQLIATTYDGSIQRWNEQQRSWQAVGKTHDARFFHRMLPLNDRKLVSIGGSNMSAGKYVALETIDVPSMKN